MAAFVCASEGTAPLGYGGWYNALCQYILPLAITVHTQTKIPQGTQKPAHLLWLLQETPFLILATL